MAPLDAIEKSLLARVADGDDDACVVLADHWAALGDPARCELIHIQRRLAGADDACAIGRQRELLGRHGERWLAPAIAAGFASEALVFERGFLRAAPVVSNDESPDQLFRLSPIVYWSREPNRLLRGP